MKVLKNQVTPSFLSLFSCWGCDGQISQGQLSFLLKREEKEGGGEEMEGEKK